MAPFVATTCAWTSTFGNKTILLQVTLERNSPQPSYRNKLHKSILNFIVVRHKSIKCYKNDLWCYKRVTKWYKPIIRPADICRMVKRVVWWNWQYQAVCRQQSHRGGIWSPGKGLEVTWQIWRLSHCLWPVEYNIDNRGWRSGKGCNPYYKGIRHAQLHRAPWRTKIGISQGA